MENKNARKTVQIKNMHADQESSVTWNLSMPSDVFSEYSNAQKCKRFFHPDHKTLLELFKNNSAFFTGKNALVEIEKNDRRREHDYSEQGELVETRLWEKNKLVYRSIEPDEKGKLLTTHIFIDKKTLQAKFSDYKKANGNGLIKYMDLSINRGLKVINVNGADIKGSPEARKINRDIVLLLENKSHIADNHSQLADIILPIQETIEMIRQSAEPLPA